MRVTPNVYPGIDELDIVPARAVIHDAFEEHIIHAPGMGRVGELVAGRILPTPGAVLMAAEALAETSATSWWWTWAAPPPTCIGHRRQPRDRGDLDRPAAAQKRTVEGDLGTFVSAQHVAELLPSAERPDACRPPCRTSG